MQPASTEASQNATSVESPATPPSTSHHGLSHTQLQASDGNPSLGNLREPSAVFEDTSDALSVSSGGTRRGRATNAGRLNSRDNSSQEGSPGSRIEEYERASLRYRKPSDEMMFQLIPSDKNKPANVTVEDFPNGEQEARHTGLWSSDNVQRCSLTSYLTCLQRLFRL
jgi:hypothetical protein